MDHFGDGLAFGVAITYVRQTEPRGTAGAILDELDAVNGTMVVMYGDTMLDVDLNRFVNAHRHAGAEATLFLHPNDHPHDSDLVAITDDGQVTGVFPYPHPEGFIAANLVNAALYVIERSALLPFQALPGLLDFGKHLFPRMLEAGARLKGYNSPEYIKDAGTPERVDKVVGDLRSGLINARSLRSPAPAVFLDRDGVLNQEVNRISHPYQLVLIDGVAAALKKLNRSFYRTVVITNQPVVACGDCDEAGLRRIHDKLETLLGREGAYYDALYYCPHHPECGFAGERVDLKIECTCRKPATGLIDRACAELNIDRSRSWFIGDTTVDILAAQRAGIGSVCVETGHAGKDGRHPVAADLICADLGAAVTFILKEERVTPLVKKTD